jgi:phytoene synthase
MAGVAPNADELEVERIVKRSGTSFYQGMKILPEPRRRAMWAIYAFCRVVDDIADEPAPDEEKQAGLNEWRGRIAQLYAGNATDPITRCLLQPVADYKLHQADFRAVIDGMEMDSRAIVAPDWETLDLYCDRVAAAVGRLSVRAFGDASSQADEVAWALGRALQFTNILRDLKEDAARGRLYLPANWLAAAHIDPADPAAAVKHREIGQVCERMAAQAHRYYSMAEAAMTHCNRTAMRPARIMAVTYRGVLKRLEKRGWRDLDTPVHVPKPVKLWFLLRYGFL